MTATALKFLLLWCCFAKLCAGTSPAATHQASTGTCSQSEEKKSSITNDINYSAEESSAQKGGGIILFDGICNFCNFWVDLLASFDPNCKFRVCAIQTEKGKSLLEDVGITNSQEQLSSVVLISQSRKGYQLVYKKSTAILKVGTSTQLSYSSIPKFICILLCVVLAYI